VCLQLAQSVPNISITPMFTDDNLFSPPGPAQIFTFYCQQCSSATSSQSHEVQLVYLHVDNGQLRIEIRYEENLLAEVG
jgi:hypothetical protein